MMSEPEPESVCIQAVREWHAKFDVPVGTREGIPPNDRCKLRVALVYEEFLELDQASAKRDKVAVADALADLLYVVYGAALEWGIPLDAVFREVHRSNMTKTWDDGTAHYREDGKILKPPTYSPADVRKVLES